MTQELARGCRLERRGGTWLIWESLGFVLYVGDAEGALAYITRKGLQP